MSDPTPEELRAEALTLVDETRRHLQWLQDSGLKRLVKDAPPQSASAFRASPPQVASRPRPSFAADPPASPPQRPAPLPQVSMPARPAAAPTAAPDRATALKLIRDDLGDCQRCPLGKTRTKLVYGQGNPNAEVLFLGEAPGEDEDLSGLAFVGKAGQLLTKMIEAMGFTRDQVYICNINKCRPPGNRKPEPNEVEACRPFVEQQIRAIKPKVVVALGATATHSLLRTEVPISKLRNVWTDWEGVPVMPTFHPSYLLRSPNEKGKAWDDLKLVLAKIGREVPKPKAT